MRVKTLSYLFVLVLFAYILAGCANQENPTYLIMKARNNVSICETISDNYWKDKCYYDVALGQNEIVICERIVEAGLSENCTNNINLYPKNISICLKVPEESREDCFGRVNNADISSCEQLNDEKQQTICKWVIESKTMDYSTCESDSIYQAYTEAKESCYASVAYNNQSPLPCNQMDFDKFQVDCYINLAKVKKNPLICNRLTYQVPMQKESCLIEVAKETGDKSICDVRVGYYRRNECYRALSGY